MAQRKPQLTIIPNQTVEYPEPKTPLGKKLIELARQAEEEGIEPLSVEDIEKHLGRELGGVVQQIRKGRRG